MFPFLPRLARPSFYIFQQLRSCTTSIYTIVLYLCAPKIAEVVDRLGWKRWCFCVHDVTCHFSLMFYEHKCVQSGQTARRIYERILSPLSVHPTVKRWPCNRPELRHVCMWKTYLAHAPGEFKFCSHIPLPRLFPRDDRLCGRRWTFYQYCTVYVALASCVYGWWRPSATRCRQ